MTTLEINVLTDFKHLLTTEGKIELAKEIMTNQECRDIISNGLASRGNFEQLFEYFPENIPSGWEINSQK